MKFLFAMAAIGVAALCVWMGATMWQDCRKDHGILYCMHVLGG